MERFFKKLFPDTSPVELLKEHTEICVKVVDILERAVKDYLEGNTLEDYEREVDELEDASDELKLKAKEIYKKLKLSFFDKVESMRLVSDQERIVDLVDDILKLLMMNRVEGLPEEVRDGLLKLSREVKNAVTEMGHAIEELERVVESGFSPYELKKENKLTKKVESEETSTDEIGKELGKMIFSLKNTLNPVDVIYLERITTMLMKIADLAENAAERILMLIA